MLITAFEAIPQKDVLVYYGGSFNPPHLSHVLFTVTLHCLIPKARILVAPTWQHAFDKRLLPYSLRLQMLHAVLDGFPNIEVSTIERDLGQPKSYTVNVVKALRERIPEKKILIAIGADIVPTLPQWFQYDTLASLADFLVFPRQGYDADALPLAPLPQVSSSEIRLALERHAPEDEKFLQTFLPTQIRMMLNTNAADTPNDSSHAAHPALL